MILGNEIPNCICLSALVIPAGLLLDYHHYFSMAHQQLHLYYHCLPLPPTGVGQHSRVFLNIVSTNSKTAMCWLLSCIKIMGMLFVLAIYVKKSCFSFGAFLKKKMPLFLQPILWSNLTPLFFTNIHHEVHFYIWSVSLPHSNSNKAEVEFSISFQTLANTRFQKSIRNN